jgi:hypothetical protein
MSKPKYLPTAAHVSNRVGWEIYDPMTDEERRTADAFEGDFEKGWEEYHRVHGEGVDLGYRPGGAGRWGA